uniref:Cytochrome b5 n=1 Tax=Trichuris muris TaxID=70415 RepID=A0A5S6QHR9_TRIMR
MPAALRKFTRSEVKEHNAKSSTWLVIENKVYDVTPFLDEHPGGIEVLLEHAGRDATEGFEDAGHSNDAKEIREQYLIGEVIESEQKQYESRVNHPGNKSTGSVFNATWTNWLIPSAIAVVVLLSYRLISSYFQPR